ncbi:putative MFS family arabinose efflux permease [Palleronia aestuarii]|uniref:Putative MFS family arabinose efflux permease n=1 Tax=Palleronia aestuarii TaxID=568105 RepID=A0A2W7N227_9RHOB|nr:MFS transporter [Palleronia aestuarii]PZX10914.1 putative MFS family arabinose efflux permease [Palleronia aestuarii]
MQTLTRIASAGSAATAIAFGPARIGFGLFLPQFRETFSISTGTAGLISSLSFATFFLALGCSYKLIARAGPRVPIVIGMIAATLGLAAVAAAPNTVVLAIGICLASASAGFSWTPFNNAAQRVLYERDRPGALSVISSGTAIGVLLAGLLALSLAFFGYGWRAVWAVFAAGAAGAAIANLMALSNTVEPAGDAPPRKWRELLTRSAIPLHLVAFSFGMTNGIYVTFAADRVTEQGGLAGLPSQASGAIVFAAYGAFGLLGLLTARIKSVIGLAWLLRALNIGAAMSIAIIAWAPTSWSGVIVSAGLQGIFVMMISAVLSLWSERLFPDLPSLSFTTALLITGAGNIAGPPVAGFVASAFGPVAMFLGTATLAFGTALFLKPGIIREKASNAASA